MFNLFAVLKQFFGWFGLSDQLQEDEAGNQSLNNRERRTKVMKMSRGEHMGRGDKIFNDNLVRGRHKNSTPPEREETAAAVKLVFW